VWGGRGEKIDKKDIESVIRELHIKLLTFQIPLPALYDGECWAPQVCGESKMCVSYDQQDCSAQTLSLVVNDAHELSAGQGPGSINLLTSLLHQTAHGLSGTGESHMIIG